MKDQERLQPVLRRLSRWSLIITAVIGSLSVFLAFQFSISPVYAEKEPNEVIAGVHNNFPPQYSIDEQTGKPIGFAIDAMDEIARRAGLHVRYVVFDKWPPIYKALEVVQSVEQI